MTKHVLVLSNEADLSLVLELELRYEGFQVSVKHDGLSGLITARKKQPDLIILEYTFPMLSGLEIIRRIRTTSQDVPIIILDKAEADNCVKALDAGADDYLTRPVSIEELLARIRSHFRRLYRHSNPESLRFRDLRIDFNTREVYRGKRLIQLTPKEFDLLAVLVSHPRQVLSRSCLMEKVWHYDFRDKSNALDVYIRYLRLKLEAKQESRLIHTVRGVGYVLKETFEEASATSRGAEKSVRECECF